MVFANTVVVPGFSSAYLTVKCLMLFSFCRAILSTTGFGLTGIVSIVFNDGF